MDLQERYKFLHEALNKALDMPEDTPRQVLKKNKILQDLKRGLLKLKEDMEKAGIK